MTQHTTISAGKPAVTRQLDVSHKTGIAADGGAVTVKLALSTAEAGALRVKAAQDGRMQVDVDPVTGMVTITGDASLVQAALQDVQLDVAPGFAKTFKMDIHVAQGGATHHEQLILYFESASSHHVPMDGRGSGASSLQAMEEYALARFIGGSGERQLQGNGQANTKASASYAGTETEDYVAQVTFLPPLELRPGYIAPVFPLSFQEPGIPPSNTPAPSPIAPTTPVAPVSVTPATPSTPSSSGGGGGGGGGSPNVAPTVGTAIIDHMRTTATAVGAYTLNAATSFTDPDSTLTYSMTTAVYANGDPAGWVAAGFLGINAGTGVITNSGALTAGAVLVTVTASDGTASVSESYELYIPSAAVLLGTAASDNLNPAGTAGVDELWGDDGNDTLNALAGGTAGTPDIIHGGEGNDSLSDSGNDVNVIFGGNGNDTLVSGTGADTLHGGDGNDSLSSGNGAGYVSGGSGNDTVAGGTGSDVIYTGNGDDSVAANSGTDQVFGGEGNDTFAGQNGNDDLRGGNGNDSLDGGAASDEFYGETGADSLAGGASGDAFRYTLVSNSTSLLTDIVTDFTYGEDLLAFASGGFAGVTDIVAGAATPTAFGYTFDGTHTVVVNAAGTFMLKLTGNIALNSGVLLLDTSINGIAGSDTVTGTINAETIYGQGGGDSIMGNGGADTIYGGTGDDTVVTGTGTNDAYGEDGNDSILGNTGNEDFRGGIGADTLNGGGGDDVLRGEDGVDSLLGAAANDTFNYTTLTESIATAEDIIGDFTQTSDIIRIIGLGVTGIAAGAAAGANLGYAFDGTHTVITHPTSTFSIKLLGNFALDSSNFNFNGLISGTAGSDTIHGTEFSETVNGGDGADSLNGSGSSDTLFGGNGDDTLQSAGGSVRLSGEANNDSIIGNATVTQTITGGDGVDTMSGGNSNAGTGLRTDNFVYNAITESGIGAGLRDIITDFSQAAFDQDKIDLSAFAGAATFRAGGNGVADFAGGFQVAYQQGGGNTIVMVDTDGNNATDFEIQLTGLYTLVGGDFVL